MLAPRFRLRHTLLLVLALGGSACRKPAPEPDTSVAVKVVKVSRGTVLDEVVTSGALGAPPGWDVKLGSLVPGRLAEVRVAEGDRVQPGQLLMRIEATTLKDQVSASEGSLIQARAKEQTDKARHQRSEQLFDEGIVARQEVDDARAQEAASVAAVRSAQALLSTARNQLGRSELKAPFKGAVVHVFAAAGEPVEGNGKPLIEVTRTEALELRANLSSMDLARIHPGQKAQLTLDGFSDAVAGQVIAVSPTLDAVTGTGVARIEVDNSKGQIKGGTFAKVHIVVAEHANVLEVPRESLIPAEGDPKGAAVMVPDSEGKARRRSVKVGFAGGQWAEIIQGLEENESVIVGGAYALPDGTPVRAR